MDRAAAQGLLDRLHAAQTRFYAGGADEPWAELLTEDVVWRVPGSSAIAGTYTGIDEVTRYFLRRRALAAGTLRLHPGDLLVGEGDHVASLTDGSATLGGIEVTWSTTGLYRVRAGRVARCWLLPLDQGAFDRVWAG